MRRTKELGTRRSRELEEWTSEACFNEVNCIPRPRNNQNRLNFRAEIAAGEIAKRLFSRNNIISARSVTFYSSNLASMMYDDTGVMLFCLFLENDD